MRQASALKKYLHTARYLYLREAQRLITITRRIFFTPAASEIPRFLHTIQHAAMPRGRNMPLAQTKVVIQVQEGMSERF